MIKAIVNLLLRKPILAIYDVTKLCNQRCTMCNIPAPRSNDMDPDTLVKEVAALRRFGICYVFLQGGEPLIRQDIIAVVDLFLKYHIKPTIITNGILLVRNLAEQIAARNCNLAISIDSMKPDLFARLRGDDQLGQILHHVRDIAGLKRRGNWSITTTVTRLSTLDDVQDIERFASDHGFMFAIRPYVFVRGVAGRKDDELLYTWEDVHDVYAYMLERAYQNNYLAYLLYREHVRYIRGERLPMCDAAHYSFLMSETGRKSPCIELTGSCFTLENFRRDRREFYHQLEACNRFTPCFYNDAREIGVLWRSKWLMLLKARQIIQQLRRYGNFF
ncbi:MAG: radical SAM protein [Planctomycetes bacterium RBG_16_64_10]|nr:MAG: radical SAM protein [Planctomycetes bacterium RBG_16_64_10]